MVEIVFFRPDIKHVVEFRARGGAFNRLVDKDEEETVFDVVEL